MEKTIQTNLCNSIRAIGIQSKLSHNILNEIIKKYDNNGVEETVRYIKDLRQWYETYLAGDPRPPQWHKRSKEGTPLGVWGAVFKLKPGKALGVLSLSTVFKHRELSPTQWDKFMHGLEGNGFNQLPNIPMSEFTSDFSTANVGIGRCTSYHLYKRLNARVLPPSPQCITGMTIPLKQGEGVLRPSSDIERAEALRLSWEAVPLPLIEFLDSLDMQDHIPGSLWDYSAMGNYYDIAARNSIAGRVSILQEAELKARPIANPNRVVQYYLEPLKDLYMETLRSLPTDCTHNQESGVQWVQQQLAKGVQLSGSDLSNATDLLSREKSLELVGLAFNWDSECYAHYTKLFMDISDMQWESPNGLVSWKQGQPLGTGPSFGLLGLTNNLVGIIASQQAGVPEDSFRVIGDDIIMDTRMLPYYEVFIQDFLGGEINQSKTLTSDTIAEFAGRIISPKRSYLKKIKFNDPSDRSFMDYMSQLGPQAISLLKPRQKKVFKHFRYVPGVAIDGPYLKDSYGEPLSDRLEWYYQHSTLDVAKPEPDKVLRPVERVLLDHSIVYERSPSQRENDFSFPVFGDDPDEDYLSSQISTKQESKDPRDVDGRSTLQVFEKHLNESSYTPYTQFKEQADDAYEEDKPLLRSQMPSPFEDLFEELEDDLEIEDEGFSL